MDRIERNGFSARTAYRRGKPGGYVFENREFYALRLPMGSCSVRGCPGQCDQLSVPLKNEEENGRWAMV